MKRFVQIGSFIGLLLALMVSVQAQISKTYDVKIPFDFNIGRDAYEAGTYRVSVLENRLLIRNQKTNAVKILMVSPDNRDARTEAPRFTFGRIDGKTVLIEVAGNNFNVRLEKIPPSSEAYAGNAAPPAAN